MVEVDFEFYKSSLQHFDCFICRSARKSFSITYYGYSITIVKSTPTVSRTNFNCSLKYFQNSLVKIVL